MSLQAYFDENKSPEHVHEQLTTHGQDRLYRAAAQRKNLIKGAKAWASLGRDPATVTLDEILLTLPKKESKAETLDEDRNLAGYGPREIPPDTRDQDEIEADNDWPDIFDEEGNDASLETELKSSGEADRQSSYEGNVSLEASQIGLATGSLEEFAKTVIELGSILTKKI